MYLRLGVKLILTIFTKRNFVWVPKQIFNCSLKVSLNYCTKKTWSSGKSVNLVELSLFQSSWYGVGTYSGLGDYSFFSACKVEGYWRWALTWGWALYQINNGILFSFQHCCYIPCEIPPWNSTEIHGNLWKSMEFHGNRWKSMEFHETPMDYPWSFHGVPWSIHGVPWNAMEFHGVSMEFHGIPWSSTEFHEVVMEFHGMPWNSMKYCGVPWNAMGFPEVPMQFHGMP